MNGLEKLKKKDNVIIFYSDKTPNIKLEKVHQMIEQKLLFSFKKVICGTPNALDFQLLTALTHYLEKDRNCCIISRDTGFDAALPELNSYGLGNVSRYSSIEHFFAETEISTE